MTECVVLKDCAVALVSHSPLMVGCVFCFKRQIFGQRKSIFVHEIVHKIVFRFAGN